MAYGYIGSLRAHPGTRDELIAIMLSVVNELRAAGCQQYTIGAAADDDVTIWACSTKPLSSSSRSRSPSRGLCRPLGRIRRVRGR